MPSSAPYPSPLSFHLNKKRKKEKKTHNDNMILPNLNVPPFLPQLHLGRPVRARLVAVMVAVGDCAVNHEVELVVAVRVDLDGAVVAAGDVRPDGFAEVADFWGRWGGFVC